MIIGLYTVFDKIAEEAGPVFQGKNEGVAIRQTVALMLQNPHIYVPDYSLYKIAEWDTENMGMVVSKKEIDFLTTYYMELKYKDEQELKITEVKS